MQDFFAKCNMVIRSELDFQKSGELIKLPFYFHIRDVKNDILTDKNENELETYSKEIYFQNKDCEQEEEYKQYLRFVDLKQWTFSDVDKNNPLFVKDRNDYVVKDIDSLYVLLVEHLGFNELDFQTIKMFIEEKQVKLLISFREMCDNTLEVASGKVEPNDVFMILRCAYELNHYATVFEENKDKPISEYSYRELCVQRSYMARKCEIERLQMEESLKKSKK